MRALILEGPRSFSYAERPLPRRAAGEVLLKVDAVSICGSDIHAINGTMPLFTFPRVVGHEIAGTVVETDAQGSRFSEGDRVAVMPTIACGKCIACKKGKTNCCVNLRIYGVQVDGGLQEYLSLPEAALIAPPEGAGPDETSLLEPLTIGAHALSRIRLDAGDRALILGAGPIGVCCAILARADGVEVTLADVNPERAAFVRERFGFEVVDPLIPSDGEPFHAVFDTTANKGSMDSAYTRIGNGGSIVFVGMHPGTLTMNGAAFHMREPTLAVTRNSTPADFEKAIGLWREGRLSPGVLQTHHAYFDEAAEAVPRWASGEEAVFKGVIRMYNA